MYICKNKVGLRFSNKVCGKKTWITKDAIFERKKSNFGSILLAHLSLFLWRRINKPVDIKHFAIISNAA